MVSVPAGALLISFTAVSVAAVVYAISMLATFSTSAAYHLGARTPKSQRVLRRLDHGMIFVLIAGSWTPLFATLHGRTAFVAGIAIWSMAALGLVLALTWTAPSKKNALYLVMGWVAVGILPFSSISAWEFVWIAAGGLFYTVGAVLFFKQCPRLSPATFGFHELWHLFTVIGASCHFVAVALVLVS